MLAAPCTTSPSTLQLLEQGLSRLVEAESEEGIIRALDAYLRCLPDLSFAQLSLRDSPSPNTPNAGAAIVRTWLLGPSAAAGSGPKSFHPVRECASLDFAIRPGATGQLVVYGPWSASDDPAGVHTAFDGLRILTLTLGAHLARVWRTGVTAIATAADETPASAPVRHAAPDTLELEPLRFLEAIDAYLTTAQPGASLMLVELNATPSFSYTASDDPLLRQCYQYFRKQWPGIALGARSRPGELALFRSSGSTEARAASEGLEQAKQIARELEAELGIRLRLSQAFWPRHGQTAGELLRHARSAWSNEPSESLRESSELRREAIHREKPADLPARMRAALQRLIDSGQLSRELRVVYQPRISLKDMSLCGAEALLRWRSQEFGEVAPSIFLPLLEELGVIVKVGEWVLSEACRQARRWADAGMPIKRLAVNLSASQLRAPETAAAVQRLMVETGLVAWCELEVEVTESTLMSDRDRVVDQLQSLSALGVRVAVDDFGLGHTALGWLASFPVSTIKVDRLFLAEVESNPNHAKLARAMFELGRALNLRVSAEGVETASQLDFVRAGGCEEAQGYYIGRPLEAMHFMADASHLCH